MRVKDWMERNGGWKKSTIRPLWGRLGKGFNTLDSLEAIKTLMGSDYLTAHLNHETLVLNRAIELSSKFKASPQDWPLGKPHCGWQNDFLWEEQDYSEVFMANLACVFVPARHLAALSASFGDLSTSFSQGLQFLLDLGLTLKRRYIVNPAS